MRVKDLPDAEQPLFKLKFFGTDVLTNTELVQLMTGVNDLETASNVLSINGDMFSLHKAELEELESINGIGEISAGRILAALEFGRRAATVTPTRTKHIFTADDVYKMFAPDALTQHQEVVSALLLNAKYEVISKEFISKGGIVAAHVEPRDVFRPAVKRGATGVILVHNHPSGDPTPSEDDIYSTKRISQCGDLIGIKLIDHIVVGHGRFSSMRDMHFMEFGELGDSKVAEEKDKERDRIAGR